MGSSLDCFRLASAVSTYTAHMYNVFFHVSLIGVDPPRNTKSQLSSWLHDVGCVKRQQAVLEAPLSKHHAQMRRSGGFLVSNVLLYVVAESLNTRI